MQIQLNTDKHIDGNQQLAAQVREVVESALARFSDQITRVDVHLSDENSHKNGQDDQRCMMEAQLAGRRPLAVTHQAATLVEALGGAADQLKRSLESTLGRLQDHR